MIETALKRKTKPEYRMLKAKISTLQKKNDGRYITSYLVSGLMLVKALHNVR